MSFDWDITYVNRVLEGDKESFRYFIKSYHQMALSIAMSLVKNESDAQDVVQSAFIKSYKALRTFDQAASFSTWFYKIVVNEGLQFLRKRKRRNILASGYDLPDDVLVSFNEAVQRFDNNEKKEMVNRVLNLMKPKEALVLKLFYLHDESIAEISNMTGFTSSSVKVLLHRARKSFAHAYHNKP